MANTLTAILPTIYEALYVISRERIGYVGSCIVNSNQIERAAYGQTINFPIVPAVVGEDITPAMTAPSTGSQTIGAGSVIINKLRRYPVIWTGEEQKSLTNGDSAQLNNVLRDQFAQAFRTAANEIETDLRAAAIAGASRAFGTAGTTPFNTASDLSDAAGVAKILDDNGAPLIDRHLVLTTAAIANLRSKQTLLVKVNESGNDRALREGLFDPIFDFAVHTSGQSASFDTGTGAGYLVNDATGLAVGDTAIVVDTGTGAIPAGTVITFAGDTVNKYVVTTAYVGGSGTITIASPGIRTAIADNAAITVSADYTSSIALQRSALHLVMRAPARPQEGDMASDVALVSDPTSGLLFEVSHYKGFYQNAYQVAAAWGAKVSNPEHVTMLLG